MMPEISLPTFWPAGSEAECGRFGNPDFASPNPGYNQPSIGSTA